MIQLWKMYCRSIDRMFLWPACKDQAKGDITVARQAFFFHMNIDTAYSDMSYDAKVMYAERLR